MKQNNFVAKHMNNFNRASVVPDKRDKHLAEEYEKEMDYPSEEEDDDCIPD